VWLSGDSFMANQTAMFLNIFGGDFMNKMIVGVSALLGLIAAPALAADLAPRTYTKAPPVAAVYDWTGGYVGIEGGYGWPFGSDRSWNCSTPAAAAATSASASASDFLPPTKTITESPGLVGAFLFWEIPFARSKTSGERARLVPIKIWPDICFALAAGRAGETRI
jgi:hypothetical protein